MMRPRRPAPMPRRPPARGGRGLGTTIVPNEGGVSTTMVKQYCMDAGNGHVCCKFLGGGAGVCPSGYGLVDSDYDNVTLNLLPGGMAELYAGPPGEAISAPFALPGVTNPPPPPKPAPPAPAKKPPAPGPAPADTGIASTLQKYGGTIAVGVAIAIGAWFLSRPRAAAAAPAPPPSAPAAAPAAAPVPA